MYRKTYIYIISIGLIFSLFMFLTREEKIYDDMTIIAFGDSLTEGFGLSIEDSYPSILENYLKDKDIVNVEVINQGNSGDTTRDAVLKIDNILSLNPDIVILAFGANDMLRRYSILETKSNFEIILEKLKESNIETVIVGIEATFVSGFQYKKELEEMYEDLSNQYNYPLVSSMLDNISLKTDLNQNDLIHPNRSGYEIMVKENIGPEVLKYIKEIYR